MEIRMAYNENASSMELLEEALTEILELSREAQANNPLLSEGLELTPFERVILERDFLIEQEAAGEGEAEGPGFLEKTTAAVEKLKAAAEQAVKEIKAYNDKLPAGVFLNIGAALDQVQADIKDKMPGDSFISKIGSGAGLALKSLFGKEDDPVEEVTALIADVNMFKSVLAKALSTITAAMANVKYEDDSGLTPAKKAEMNADKIGNLVGADTFDAEKHQDLRDAGFPDAKAFEKAVAKTFKEPSGMFGGLKKLGSSLGIGMGGDVPLADYIDAEGLFDDIMDATPEQLSALSGELAKDTGRKSCTSGNGRPTSGFAANWRR